MKSSIDEDFIGRIVSKRMDSGSYCNHRRHSSDSSDGQPLFHVAYDIDSIIHILNREEALGNDIIIVNAIPDKKIKVASMVAFNSLKLTVSMLMLDCEDYPIDPTDSVLYKKHVLYYRVGLTPKRDDLPSDLNKLPKLNSNDIVCRWLGFRIDDVVQVNGEYRLVV